MQKQMSSFETWISDFSAATQILYRKISFDWKKATFALMFSECIMVEIKIHMKQKEKKSARRGLRALR